MVESFLSQEMALLIGSVWGGLVKQNTWHSDPYDMKLEEKLLNGMRVLSGPPPLLLSSDNK